MLKNYLKIAIKVMLRRKFFTAVSLFGISFTLLILIVATALLEDTFGSKAPENKKPRILYVSNLTIQYKSGGWQSGPPSFRFLEENVKVLKTPEKVSIYSLIFPATTYTRNKKLKLFMKFTDEEFWDILNFTFVQGKPFANREIKSGDKVAVVNESTSRSYFGSTSSIGKYIKINRESYRVIGVVEDVSISRINAYSDVWIPYSARPEDLTKSEYFGHSSNHCMAMILARNVKDTEPIRKEYEMQMAKLYQRNSNSVSLMKSEALSLMEASSKFIFGDSSDAKSNVKIIKFALSALAFLFMLLPALNLLNLNISRIMERASEIGMRKSFGATAMSLVFQFVIENLFLTLLGGAISFILAYFSLKIINSSGLIPHADLSINLTVFGFGMLLCIVFSLMSGVLPAYSMSRLQIVQSLKESKK